MHVSLITIVNDDFWYGFGLASFWLMIIRLGSFCFAVIIYRQQLLVVRLSVDTGAWISYWIPRKLYMYLLLHDTLQHFSAKQLDVPTLKPSKFDSIGDSLSNPCIIYINLMCMAQLSQFVFYKVLRCYCLSWRSHANINHHANKHAGIKWLYHN